jgi:hypothetical protein
MTGLLYPKLRLDLLPAMLGYAVIHNASYLGGLLGLIIALIQLNHLKQTPVKAPCQS